jgi:hypothetical protein
VAVAMAMAVEVAMEVAMEAAVKAQEWGKKIEINSKATPSH